MTLIAVNGSPRRNGATNALTAQILQGASEAGARADVFHLGAMDLAGCTGCMGCKQTGRCVIADDMQRFYDAVGSATAPKALVVGTPIYFDHVTSQLKQWLDRLYCYTFNDLGERTFPTVFQAVLAATWGWDKEDAYDDVLDWLAGRLEHYHGIEVIGRVAMAGADARPLDARPELTARARQLGRALANGR